jgi:hypothetical protein
MIENTLVGLGFGFSGLAAGNNKGTKALSGGQTRKSISNLEFFAPP